MKSKAGHLLLNARTFRTTFGPRSVQTSEPLAALHATRTNSKPLGARSPTTHARFADSATTALGVFDKEKKLSGPISEVLDDAARQIAEGKPAKQVRADAYDRIRPLLDQVLASGSHTADSTGKGRAGAGARVSESGLFDDPVGDSGTPQGSPVRGFPRPASEGGTESTLGFISTKRVPSTLAGHDLVVSGDKVLDIVPAGAEAKTPEPVDAPPMESLLRAGQSHKIVVPKTSAGCRSST